jgi:hypothetical protein
MTIFTPRFNRRRTALVTSKEMGRALARCIVALGREPLPGLGDYEARVVRGGDLGLLCGAQAPVAVQTVCDRMAARCSSTNTAQALAIAPSEAPTHKHYDANRRCSERSRRFRNAPRWLRLGV